MIDNIYTRIGDILFYTESSYSIRAMQGRKYPLFLSQKGEPDIFHLFHGVSKNKLTLPSLNVEERKCLSKYTIRDTINHSYTIFPLKEKLDLNNPHNNHFYQEEIPQLFDLPLLRSEEVRERLFYPDNDPSQIVLILHAFTVEIYDYKSHRIDVFYPKVMRYNLNLEQMEHATVRMFRTFLSQFDAFIVHSSAVVRKGKAAMFLAQSGGGKTTVALQAPTSDILGDDQVMLRKQNGEIFAHSTPWNRITNAQVSAPLGAIFLLEKSDLFELSPLRPKEVIDFLWNEHIFFTERLSKASRLLAFNLLCEIANRVPLYRMSAPLNGVNWALIDTCL